MKKYSEFTKRGACGNRTAFTSTSKAGRALDEAAILKDFCKDILTGDYEVGKLGDLQQEVAACYTDETIDTISSTQKGYAEQLAGQIWRFGHDWQTLMSGAKVFIPNEPVILDLSSWVKTPFIDDDEIKVTIDAIVINDDNVLNAIVFKRGIPKISTTTRGYLNYKNTIELRLLNVALRKWAMEHWDELKDYLRVDLGVLTYAASYYYLKKSSDTSDPAKTTYRDGYFGNSEPIRFLEVSTPIDDELIANGPDSVGPLDDDLDSSLITLLDEWAGGYDKSDMKESDDCVSCPDYELCYYALAPTPVEENGGVKARKKVTPTDEQMKIINSRKGIFICNAVPGSGKTETAIKQRTVSIIEDELREIEKKYAAGEDITEYLTPGHVFNTTDSRRIDPKKIKVSEGDLLDDCFA